MRGSVPLLARKGRREWGEGEGSGTGGGGRGGGKKGGGIG